MLIFRLSCKLEDTFDNIMTRTNFDGLHIMTACINIKSFCSILNYCKYVNNGYIR